MNKPIPGPEKEKKHRHNKGWMQEHVNDTYVQRAKAEGWRSRAAFKLLELDEKSRLIKPGMTVVDLGSAPGSWCQAPSKRQRSSLQFILCAAPAPQLPFSV